MRSWVIVNFLNFFWNFHNFMTKLWHCIEIGRWHFYHKIITLVKVHNKCFSKGLFFWLCHICVTKLWHFNNKEQAVLEGTFIIALSQFCDTNVVTSEKYLFHKGMPGEVKGSYFYYCSVTILWHKCGNCVPVFWPSINSAFIIPAYHLFTSREYQVAVSSRV